ncbi:MAG: DUF1576 domain-containing protein [Erysipelotrichaceae bacterium]|nr:DUF1576 domain-containing protein [Erysipelotrichaceae bacterium]
MEKLLKYRADDPSEAVYRLNLITSLILIAFGLLIEGSPLKSLQELWTVWTSPATLVTDFVAVGGMGGAFLNCGGVMLISVLFIGLAKAEWNGLAFATCFINAGYALYGKTVPNMLPIILGSWLYAKLLKQPFKTSVITGLAITCLGPLMTFLALQGPGALPFRLFLAVLFGIIVGFLGPLCAPVTLRLHNGFNLYNAGLAAGFIGMTLVSFLKNFGIEFAPVSTWTNDHDLPLFCLMLGICLLYLLGGLWMNKGLKGYKGIIEHSGRGSDYVKITGLPVAMINMGTVGIMVIIYTFLVGAHLAGPVCSGVLTLLGYAAFGKNPYTVIWLWLGVILLSFFSVWNLNDPGILLAAFFMTCLSPVTGELGPVWGMLAAMLHISLVQNTAAAAGWMNLYNNGFAAGLSLIVVLPLQEFTVKLKEVWTTKE